MREMMLRIQKPRILLPAVLALLATLVGVACAENQTSTLGNGKISRVAHAEKVLKKYLVARSSGEFKESAKYLSPSFLKMFLQTRKIEYVMYHRSDESDYRKYSISSKKYVSQDRIIFDVSSIIEDPGVRSRVSERYSLAPVDGRWIISNIRRSKQQEIVEVLDEDGKWKKAADKSLQIKLK